MKKILILTAMILTFSQNTWAKSFTIGVNPLGFAFGVGNVALDFKVSESLSLGVEYQLIDKDDDAGIIKIEDEGTAYGVRLKYFFNKAIEDSWVFTAFGGKAETDITITTTSLFGSSSASSTTTSDGMYFGAMIGYHWQWSLLFIHFGAGFVNYSLDVTSSASSSTTTSSSSSSLDGGGLALDLSIGLGF